MGTELRDNRGLICGFQLRPENCPLPIEIDHVDPLNAPPYPIWLHFNLNDSRARDWIEHCGWLSAECRELLLTNDPDIHLELMGDGTGGVLGDTFADDPDEFGVLHVYADRACLLTGRRHPISAVGSLRRELTGGTPIGDTSAAFTHLLRHLAGSFDKTIATHADLIDEAEDRVLSGNFRDANLGQHRRKMARLRRQIFADRHALASLAHPPSWWEKATVKDLRQIEAVLASAVQDLELAQERARLLTEEIDSRLTERTNRNLYFVSVAAAVFLPITLISGIFGMNVGGLPWLEDAYGFGWVMACMLAAVVTALALMRWRQML